MSRYSYVQTNFTAGEITPMVRGRIDFENFYNGVDELTNYIVFPHGSITRRPGTRFVAEVKDSADFTRLLPFQFSLEASYIIEAGDLYFRFYRDEGQLESGGSPVEVVTPYTSANLPFVSFTQSADVMFLVSPDHKPKELQRTSDITWNLVDFDFRDGPYLDTNVTTTTLTPTATTGSITITASATTGINNDTGFQSTDVGRLVRILDTGTWGYAEITAVSTTTSVTATVKSTLGGTSAAASWRLGAWSDTTGWPRTTTFFQERLWFAGTDTEPQAFWSSNSGDFDNFAPSATDGVVTDTHSITGTVASNQVNAILWMQSTSQGLLLGTSRSEVVVRPPSAASAISPDNKEVRFQTNIGTQEGTYPIKVGHSILFIQRGGIVLNEILFDFDLNGYGARNASILGEHLFRSSMFDLAYQQNPNRTIWMDNGDGRIVGLSFEKEQKVFAWHKHILGGSFGVGEPITESLAITPEGAVDQPWAIVKRTINGGTKRYIEFVEDFFDSSTDGVEAAFYVDCGLSGTAGTATDTWSGLTHLEGETVAVLADGSAHPDVVVSSGQVVLNRVANTVHIGLPYTARVTTIPLEVGAEGQTTVGKLKRAPRAFVRFIDTIGAKVGQTNSSFIDVVPFGPGNMNEHPPLFSGTKEVSLTGLRDYDLQVTVEQTQPLPSTIVNIGIEMEYA